MVKHLIIVGLILFSMFSYAREFVKYDITFKGVTVGESTLEEIVDKLGTPFDKTDNSNNVRYHFDGFDITIQNNTGRINTIIVQDPEFSDPNGIKIGTGKSAIKLFKRHITDDGNVMVDYEQGIIYWLENDAVLQIVFAHQLPKQ